MVLELCEDNAGLLSSVTVLYLNTDKDEHKEEELISILSKYIKNIIVTNNLEKAKEKAEGRDIDILITDFNLADEESMNFPMYIRRYNPSCSIIIYTNKNDPEHLLEALNMKVDNYIIKLSCFKELIKAIINLAEHAFTLKALYSIVPEKSTHLDTEAYDTISQTIDELRTIIAKMAARHCIESMPIIHSLKGIIERMKILLKISS